MVLDRSEADRLLTGPGAPFELVPVQVGDRTLACWKNIPPSGVAVLEASRAHGERPFIVYGSEQLSFADHYGQCARLARVLRERFGIRKGDRVAIAMRNFPEWSVAFWATLATGAVAVLLNAWWTSQELRYGLADAGARLAFVDPERLDRIAPFRSEAPLEVIVARATELPGWAHHMASLIATAGESDALPGVQVGPDDYATVVYTSGSTGFPKGALGTHRNLTQCLQTSTYTPVRLMVQRGMTVEQVLEGLSSAPPSASLLNLPLFHVSGCHAVLNLSLFYGQKIVMMRKWDAQDAARLIAAEGVTSFVGVPVMSWQLIEAAEAGDGLPSIRQVATAGAAAPPELLRRLNDVFPTASLMAGFGLTECSSTVCSILGPDYLARPDSVGVPPPAVEIIAADDDGHQVPTGELGELWVRGPGVVQGYWNKPEETAQAFVDGWFKTGDIGRIDEEGYVYVVDRKKDMIIRGGENVYCVEVEAALFEHPSIKGACVFGVPHPILGEEVGAVVEVTASDVTADQITNFLKSNIAGFKVPSRLWLQTEPLPLGPTGKVAKRDIKRAKLLDAGLETAQ